MERRRLGRRRRPGPLGDGQTHRAAVAHPHLHAQLRLAATPTWISSRRCASRHRTRPSAPPSPRSRPRITSTTFVDRAAPPFALKGAIPPSLPGPGGSFVVDSDGSREDPPSAPFPHSAPEAEAPEPPSATEPETTQSCRRACEAIPARDAHRAPRSPRRHGVPAQHPAGAARGAE